MMASTLQKRQPHGVNPTAHIDETHVFERLSTLPQGIPHILYSRTKKSSKLPPPWREYTNFCGRTYFYNFDLRVCTEEDMYDYRLRRELNNAILFDTVWYDNDGYERWPWPLDVQHLLWYCRTAEQPHFTGITMSCQHGGVFEFLHDDVHLGQAEMWDFLYRYSMHYTRIPPFVEAQFLCAVAYGANEKALLTDDAKLPFTNEEWEGIMNVYNDLKGRIRKGPDGPYFVPSLIWHMAKTMKDVWNSRQHHHFGTIQAHTTRVHIETTIKSAEWHSNMLRMIIGIVFLGAHSVYFERLQNVSLTDDLMCSREFGGFVDSLITEWENSNLLATVFLGSNIGFLALNNLHVLQTTASLASTLCSITSLIIGMSYLWQHRSKSDPGYLQIHRYINHRLLTLDPKTVRLITACFLSVPVVMLQWSALYFLVSLMSFSIQEVGRLGGEFLSALLGVLTMCFFGAVIFFWKLWRDV